jgi:DNA-binding SARP family transcriptional activator
MFEFGILGPLVLRHDAGDITLSGMRRRQLLIRLLISATRHVPAELLIEELWEGAAPRGASSTIQSHISFLRRNLPADRLRYEEGAYALRVAEDELDASLAARESRDGGRALEAGDLEDAVGLLRRSLGRWRGIPLADVRGVSWALPEIARLGELQIATLEALHEALLAQGRAQEVVQSAEPAVALYPLRERLWAQLMLALYRTDRQAEALRTYARLRTNLVDELGLEPNRELVELETSILLHKPALDWTPPSTSRIPTGGETSNPPGDAGVSLPLPDKLAVTLHGFFGRAPIFIGRERESELLRQAMKAAAAEGHVRAVLIGGEPGIGKTLLAVTVANDAHSAGATVLYGRCDEDLGIPYQPWREALSHLFNHASPTLDSLVERHHPALSTLGLLGPAMDVGGTQDVEIYVLFRAVLDLLAAMASLDRGLVLVLDDLHWADLQTLQLLRTLVTGTHRMPVLVIVTFRDSEIVSGTPFASLLADLRRDARVERINLKGLDGQELLSLLETEAGHDLDESVLPLRDALLSETEGNPFFVGEMLRHLTETGALTYDDIGGWAPESELVSQDMPASLSEVISERVARLGTLAAGILPIAAVIGREFELDVLATATETEPGVVLDELEKATKASILIDLGAGRFSFTHALVDRALYAQLNPTRRAFAHAHVAEAIARVSSNNPGRTAEIAHHWMKATVPQDGAKALSYARQAADYALSRLAPDEARRWYTEALGLLDQQGVDEEHLRCELLVGLGDAMRQCGDPAHRETLLLSARLATELDDTSLVVRAAIANTRGFFAEAGHVDTDRLAVLEEAKRRTQGGSGSQRARVLGLLAAELAFSDQHERRRSVADEALAAARETADVATLVAVLNHRIAAIQAPDTLGEVLANTAEALRLADGVHNPLLSSFAAGWRYVVAWQAVDRTEADRMWRIMEEAATALGQPTLRWLVAFMAAHRATVDGELAEAERLTEEALKFGMDTGQPDAFSVYGAQILRIARERDTAEDFIPILEGVVVSSPDDAAAQTLLARLYCDLGRFEEARGCVEPYVNTNFSIHRNVFWMCTLSLIADTLGDINWVEPAPTLSVLIGRYAAQWDWIGPTSNGPVARVAARLSVLVEDDATADALFRQAVSISEAMRSPLHLAHSHLDWGRALALRPGPHAKLEARAHLEQAATLADAKDLRLLRRLATNALVNID